MHKMKFFRSAIGSALALLFLASFVLHTPEVAFANSVNSVTIIIEADFRSNQSSWGDERIRFRIRGTRGGQVEYDREIEMFTSRDSGNWWSGRETFAGLDPDLNFSVSIVGSNRNNLTSRRDTRTTSNDIREITFRFTNDGRDWDSGWRDPWDDRWDTRYWDAWHFRDGFSFVDRDGVRTFSRDRVPNHRPVPTVNDMLGRQEYLSNTFVNRMEEIARNSNSQTAAMTVNGVTHVSSVMMNALHNAAARHNRTALVYFDTLATNSSAVQGRMFVEPARHLNRTGDLRVSVFTEDSRTRLTSELFRRGFTNNNVAVVVIDQQGALGTRTRIAAQVNLSAFNRGNLIFHTYSRETNRVSVIENPEYSIDARGFVHFHTYFGGDIIITDQPLRRA